MAFCVSCCRITAFFGIIFYTIMGFIVIAQTQFLRFQINNKTSTIVACFLTALLQVGIFAGLKYYQYRQAQSNVDQPQYLKFEEERRQRESTFKGIALIDFKGIKKEAQLSENEGDGEGESDRRMQPQEKPFEQLL